MRMDDEPACPPCSLRSHRRGAAERCSHDVSAPPVSAVNIATGCAEEIHLVSQAFVATLALAGALLLSPARPSPSRPPAPEGCHLADTPVSLDAGGTKTMTVGVQKFGLWGRVYFGLGSLAGADTESIYSPYALPQSSLTPHQQRLAQPCNPSGLRHLLQINIGYTKDTSRTRIYVLR